MLFKIRDQGKWTDVASKSSGLCIHCAWLLCPWAVTIQGDAWQYDLGVGHGVAWHGTPHGRCMLATEASYLAVSGLYA